MYYAQYVKDLDNAKFRPRSCEYLEAWTSSDSHQTFCREGTLQPSEIQQWLDNSTVIPQDGLSNGLRLLLFFTGSGESRPRKNTTRFYYEKSWPFDRNTVEKLVQSFNLPLQVTQALEPSQSFSRFGLKPYNATESGAAFYLRTPRAYETQGPGQAWTYAASFDPARCMTTGFIAAHTQKALHYVCDRLRSKTTLPMWHPMMVPLVLAEIHMESAWQMLLHVVEDLGQIEYMTGQHDWDTDGKDQTSSAHYHSLTGKLTSNNVRLAHHESVCSFIVRLNEFIEKELQVTKPTRPSISSAATDSEVGALIDHNAYIKNWTECLSFQFDDIRKRTQGLSQAVLNLISQGNSSLNIEIAKDSKSIAAATQRDSTAMRTIAVITLIFFPATFMSSLFAMPLFNWDADTVVKPRFWVYWVVTIPLTVLLLIISRILDSWQAKRVRRRDPELADLNANGMSE